MAELAASARRWRPSWRTSARTRRASRPARPRSTQAETRGAAAAAARAVDVAQARGQQPGEEGRRHAARARVRVGAAADRGRGAGAGRDRRRPRPLPVRPQPGRGAAPAGQDRVGRRAVARHAGRQAGAGADDEVLTYVFDEVDAGIGGGAAEVIGRKLKRLAADRQVIVITHLPQVAAFADAHVRVTKTSAAGRPTWHRAAVRRRAHRSRSRACSRARRRPPRPPPTRTRCCATPAWSKGNRGSAASSVDRLCRSELIAGGSEPFEGSEVA